MLSSEKRVNTVWRANALWHQPSAFSLPQFKKIHRDQHHDKKSSLGRSLGHWEWGPPFSPVVLEPGLLRPAHINTHNSPFFPHQPPLLFSSIQNSINRNALFWRERNSPLHEESVPLVPTCCSCSPYPPQARSFPSSFLSLRSSWPNCIAKHSLSNHREKTYFAKFLV